MARAFVVLVLLLGHAVARADHVRPTAASDDTPVIVPEPTPNAVRFHQTGLGIWAARQLWVVAVPLAWILPGAAARLSRLTMRRGYLWHVACFAGAYSLITYLAGLAWTVLLGFVRLHDYGLSTQPFGDFVADELKSAALGFALFVAVVTGVYALIRWRPRTWWLWAGLAALPLMLMLVLVVPVVIDPLFHAYGPMTDRELEGRVLALADRAGVDGPRVFEVDMSRETVAVNAYVTGLLGTKRIVLWDTLLAKLAPEEVLAVVAHEVGHYMLNHVPQGVAVTASLTLLGLAGVALAARGLVPRWTARFGIGRLDDPGSLPVLILLAQVANFALTPAGYAVSRHVEREADRFALELTRDNGAAARAFVALQRSNLGFPRPGVVHTFFRATHPSLGERIDFCSTYRPWVEGRPLRYADRFREVSPRPAPPPFAGPR